MPQDECRDCGTHSPGGAGFKGGRCARCFAPFKERREAADLPVIREDLDET